jgi:cytoskeletal protein CcmA (bactofilin family)
MMFKSDGERGDLNGFLDAGSQIEGELHFEDTFRIDGRLSGKVVSTGDLVVGEQGQVEGEIQVGRIFISGTVKGSVQARQRVEITARSKVHADLDTPSLMIEDGAFFEGRCSMGKDRSQAAEAPPVVARMPLNKEH